MKSRVEAKHNHQWERRVGYWVWYESYNARWRMIRKARKMYSSAQNKKIKEALKRIKKMGF